MSLKDNLLKKIREQGQLSYGEMCEFVSEEGYKVSGAERELRKLVEEEKVHNLWKTSKKGTKYISGYMPGKIQEPQKKPFWVRDSDGKLEFGGYR